MCPPTWRIATRWDQPWFPGASVTVMVHSGSACAVCYGAAERTPSPHHTRGQGLAEDELKSTFYY